MDDVRITALLQSDPEQGLTELIGQYLGLVKKICGNVLNGNREEIEEAVADTFINVWHKADRFDPERGSFKSLLTITARNNAINRLKKLSRAGFVSDDILELLPREEDGLSQLLAKEDADELMGIINLLPEPDREIFIRRHYLLETVHDIADRLGLTEKQVSNRLYQSKLKLRGELIEGGANA